MMHMKCNEITYHHLQMSYKILTNPNINKITIYTKISFILNNLNNFNNKKYNYFPQLNYKNITINSEKSQYQSNIISTIILIILNNPNNF